MGGHPHHSGNPVTDQGWNALEPTSDVKYPCEDESPGAQFTGPQVIM